MSAAGPATGSGGGTDLDSLTEIRLRIAASPHMRTSHSTPKIMWNVVGSLVPILVVATWFFGPSAPLVVAAATLGSWLTERVFGPKGSTKDGSAIITGLLLGLILPPGFPLWMAFLGGVFGVGFGKVIFGGLGQNVFNPALLGRAFLQAAFPATITTWPTQPANWWALRGDNFAFPLMSPSAPDLMTGATPLGLMKFESIATPTTELMLGTTSGSIGETAGLLILLCGAYLAIRRYLDWRVPVSIFLTVGLFSGLLYLIGPDRFPTPWFMLFSGGLILGAVYMATDMVTSPVTAAGAWIFGIGIGLLVVLIRVWGGLPEGVMYAILFMNALVPFINRVTQPRVFGQPRRKPKGAEA